MIDRDDLTFATCYQLAGEIREEWEDRPEDVDKALVILSMINEPEDIYDTFHEPLKQIPMLMVICEALKCILINSDGCKSPGADMLKKEIVTRIKDYERRVKSLTDPVFDPVYVRL